MAQQSNPTPLECVVNGTECYDGWVWAIYLFIFILVYLFYKDAVYDNLNMSVCVCRLRVRIKNMQQLVDGQSERLAYLQAVNEAHNLRHQDESTGQGTFTVWLLHKHVCTCQ